MCPFSEKSNLYYIKKYSSFQFKSMNHRSLYKPFAIFIFYVLLGIDAGAQKKVVPVNQSALTGMSLPNGTKQDGRFLSEIGAKTLFELETKKAGTSVSKVEVLLITVESGFTADSLVTNLSNLGYTISPLETDNKYAWVQKDNRYFVLYFETKKSGIDLYFGELGAHPTALSTPVQNQQNTTQKQTSHEKYTTK